VANFYFGELPEPHTMFAVVSAAERRACPLLHRQAHAARRARGVSMGP